MTEQFVEDIKLDHVFDIIDQDEPVNKTEESKPFLRGRGLKFLFEQPTSDPNEEDQPPILEELDIDLQDIYHKIRFVLLPFQHSLSDRSILVEKPDFWGPLALIFVYGFLCVWKQFSAMTWAFLLWFLGSFLMYFICRVLGASISYSSTLGLVGYSVLPMIITTLLNVLVSGGFFDLVLTVAGVCWAAYSSANLLVSNAPESRKWLIVYPSAIVFTFLQSLKNGA
ncbi:hypothetical protein GEMRC1_004904 [Eukaryota sp. GEM-RC1]